MKNINKYLYLGILQPDCNTTMNAYVVTSHSKDTVLKKLTQRFLVHFKDTVRMDHALISNSDNPTLENESAEEFKTYKKLFNKKEYHSD